MKIAELKIGIKNFIIGILCAVLISAFFAGQVSKAQLKMPSNQTNITRYQIVTDNEGVYILDQESGKVVYRRKDQCLEQTQIGGKWYEKGCLPY